MGFGCLAEMGFVLWVLAMLAIVAVKLAWAVWKAVEAMHPWESESMELMSATGAWRQSSCQCLTNTMLLP
ncbi:hypothetical protein RchiOBHm_Chr1g0363091 [Rosa chinensis]|uniref:Uncharacterized protein n=1 Tax=Rosa chinensis TaxID=74649 RepID=A0A2P6SJE0_ROSCH|nr:hypothetical protein RchiOBHm_Chr1g0363091 [Rosa chinensis]